MAARPHRADEHLWVQEVLREPDPVAEQAPCENGLEGSTEITPADRSCARTCPSSAAIRVDLPTPGGPVMPIAYARPVDG